MENIFRGKNILVTGGTGSIGSAIVRKVLQYEPGVVRVLSNDENGLFSLEQELLGCTNLRFLIGDVRDKERLMSAVESIDYVFHAAALKHVPLCEYNPFEAVKTNVLGTQNLIDVAIQANLEKFIAISTDKAVNPVNVMGATKLLAERLTTSIDSHKGERRTVFSSVRFGNVLHSRGSVVPLFIEQIAKGGPVTVTDPNMTRFVMSITAAVDLVFKAAIIARGGEIFVLKMPALRIGDLAEVAIEEFAPRYGHASGNIGVKIVGRRDGEKNHEELLTGDESAYTRETEDMFIIYPEMEQRNEEAAGKRYTSEDESLLSKGEIKEMLMASLPYLSQSTP